MIQFILTLFCLVLPNNNTIATASNADSAIVIVQSNANIPSDTGGEDGIITPPKK